MRYDAKAVANEFLDLAEKVEQQLSPMKLQKLVYFAHGWNLGLTGKPLLDEQIQAWSFGPVIYSLYKEFKEFGPSPINRKAREYKLIPGPKLKIKTIIPSLELCQPEYAAVAKKLLDRIWDVYGNYSAYQLSNLTHQPDTPWAEVSRQYNGNIPKATTIPEGSIRTYFARLAGK